MKRQVTGLRKTHYDEAERSPASERKRMKLLQASQEGTSHENHESDNHKNDTSHIGSNHNLIDPSLEAPSQPLFENGSHSENYLNGSSNNGEENCHNIPKASSAIAVDDVVNVVPANLEDETILEPFPTDSSHSSPPDLQPEVDQPVIEAPPTTLDSPSCSKMEIDSDQNVDSLSKEEKPTDISNKKEPLSRASVKDTTLYEKFNPVTKLLSYRLEVTQLQGHADVVFCVDAHDDILLSASGDTTIKVWNVAERKETSSFAGHTDAVTAVVLMSAQQSKKLASKLSGFEGSRIAVSSSMDCHIRLWSLYDGKEISAIYTFNSITCLALLKDSYVVIGTEGGKVEVWCLQTARLVDSLYAHTSAVTSITVNDCYVYSVAGDGAVKVFLFDDEEFQPLYSRKRKQESDSKDLVPAQWRTVAEHSDLLFLGDTTSSIKVLNWRLGQLKAFRNQMSNNGMCETIFVKDDILLTSSYDTMTDEGGINVWQLPDIKYICTLSGDVQDICSLSLTQVGEKIRIVSSGHQLLVWDFDLTEPASDESSRNFFVHEVENIGLPVEESSTVTTRRAKPAALESRPASNFWCNIC